MDPVTHTLVGASLAESGLKRRTALGTATLLIGANFPDIDFVSQLWGREFSLWFRRGVTHGLLALVVLPVVLTGLVVLWDRMMRQRPGRELPPVGPLQVWLLASIAIATHPVLDFLNTYGMRWLMPFSDHWFYADTLFIVDPWVWGMLAGGLFVARRREKEKEKRSDGAADRTMRRSTVPARVALTVVAGYIALMAASNLAARSLLRHALEQRAITPRRMMVAPIAVTPLSRWVVVEEDDVYRFGRFHWIRRPMLELYDLSYENYPRHPAAAAAVRGPTPRQFLSWARFPFYTVERGSDHYLVRIGDARYTVDSEASWATTSVRIGTARDGRGP